VPEVASPTLDSNWRMTGLFLLALASNCLLMKLAALLTPPCTSKTDWAFILSPVLCPESLRRSRPLSALPRFLGRATAFLAATLVYYWVYWQLVRGFDPRWISYFAAPAILLLGELGAAIVTVLWLPSGRLLPPLHDEPILARGLSEFWGRRWNLWFSDWFRSAIFDRFRQRPQLALLLVFVVSGLMHEWVINLPLYLVTGRRLFGSMMLYFLLQAAGVLIEHRLLRRNALAKFLFVWLVVLGPAPLIINEGLLRALHLWPG